MTDFAVNFHAVDGEVSEGLIIITNTGQGLAERVSFRYGGTYQAELPWEHCVQVETSHVKSHQLAF